MKTLSFVIPVYNESRTLRKLVSQVLKVKLPNGIKRELVIVEDASTDDSRNIVASLHKTHSEINAYYNSQNMGKSRTVKKGILRSKGEFVIIQDSDLEYNPDEISDLLDLMLKKSLNVVYGNRFGIKNKVVYIQNYIGNRFLSAVSNIFTYPRIRVWIPDMEVCYKLMEGKIARSIAKRIQSKSNFGLEPEITARLSKYKIDGKHLKFGIVPISYKARTIKEGKHMKAFKDGTKALWEILYFNLLNKN